MTTLTIHPYDETALYAALSALLAAAPVALRTVNLLDRFTFAKGRSQTVAIEIEDIDGCIEVYLDGVETSYDLLEETR